MAAVDPAVHGLRPDYVALLVAADNLPGGPSDARSDGWLREAEAAAAEQLAGSPPEERPHVALWREAFRAFGAKPQRTRSSLLGPNALATATAAGDDLEARLRALDPAVKTSRRPLTAPHA